MIVLDLKKWVMGIGVGDSVFQLACCCIFILLHHIVQRFITELPVQIFENAHVWQLEEPMSL